MYADAIVEKRNIVEALKWLTKAEIDGIGSAPEALKNSNQT